MKRNLIHGIVAGVLATLAAIIYDKIYVFALAVDFSVVVNIPSIVASCFIGTMGAALGYTVIQRFVKRNTDIWFNLIFTIITFGSILAPLSVALPLEVSSPELFPGLSIPMHFMPQLFWLTSKPLFTK